MPWRSSQLTVRGTKPGAPASALTSVATTGTSAASGSNVDCQQAGAGAGRPVVDPPGGGQVAAVRVGRAVRQPPAHVVAAVEAAGEDDVERPEEADAADQVLHAGSGRAHPTAGIIGTSTRDRESIWPEDGDAAAPSRSVPVSRSWPR